MIWADPQVKNGEDVGKLINQSVPDVQKYMQSLPADALIHGICVGDIVWDNQSLFSSYNVAIEKCGIPFFQAIGNHDMDYRQGGDETSDVTFKKTYGPSYYSFNRGKVHYVILDDVYYLGKEREYKGFITQPQLDWLKKDLAYVSTDNIIIVCLHIPVHSQVENNAALYQILKLYSKVHIMSGHTHYNQNVIKAGDILKWLLSGKAKKILQNFPEINSRYDSRKFNFKYYLTSYFFCKQLPELFCFHPIPVKAMNINASEDYLLVFY